MTAGGVRRARRSLLAALSPLLLAGPAALHAQAPCTPAVEQAARWEPPLDRLVALSARDVSLRDALARLSAAARFRLSYSADLLPLDQRVCVSPSPVPAGDLLAALIRGSRVSALIAAPDHVVLVPGAEMATAEPDSFTRRPAAVLERVVVTGSPAGSPQRPLPVALDVVPGARLAESGTTTLARALNGAVPGVWAWSPSPASLLTRYGSVRGASSFGLSYPKVYIDGIEVANPLLVSRLTPEAVERIEIIRGPQGAALYGTDAISGVVNIVTRHESVDSGAPRFRFRSGVGISRSDFSPDATVAQDHALSFRAGSTARSLGIDVAVGSAGEFIPDAFSRQLNGSASGRIVGSRVITSLLARYEAENAGVAVSPILSGVLPAPTPTGMPAPAARGAARQSVRQYTVGASSSFAQNERWTHSLVVGLDGDRLSGIPDDRLPIPIASAADDGIANGGADRGTLRLSSVGSFDLRENRSATLTLSAEHSVLRQEEEATPDADGTVAWPARVEWRSNTGVLAQASTGIRDFLYLTGGLRLERTEGLAGSSQIATLPMFGGSIVFGDENLTLKMRTAYGKGIRPSRTPARQTGWAGYRMQLQDRSVELDPEEQSGVETGFDLILGQALTLQVTRFDQTASGLIQRVAVSQHLPPADPGHAGPKYRVRYTLQNVGRITNGGWELQAASELGRLSVSGSLSLVGSRVARVAGGYTGELRVGDRMLEVPARTAALTAAWSGRSWYASLTAQRASDWINYDRLALAQAVAGGAESADIVGARLRDYWRTYDGVTHLGATATRDISAGLRLVVAGENLLDVQRGEPDNITVLPGRTITFGIRAEF